MNAGRSSDHTPMLSLMRFRPTAVSARPLHVEPQSASTRASRVRANRCPAPEAPRWTGPGPTSGRTDRRRIACLRRSNTPSRAGHGRPRSLYGIDAGLGADLARSLVQGLLIRMDRVMIRCSAHSARPSCPAASGRLQTSHIPDAADPAPSPVRPFAPRAWRGRWPLSTPGAGQPAAERW